MFVIARISALHLAHISNTFVTTTAGTSPRTPIQFQQGMEAGMASFFAAAEEPVGYNSIFDLLKYDADFASGHNFDSPGFDLDDADLRLEGCEPGCELKKIMMHLDLEFFVPRLTDMIQQAGPRVVLGVSLAARGAQKPGPQVSLFSLDLYACVVMSLHVWILQYAGDKSFWSTKFGFDAISKLFFCKAGTCKANASACSSSLAGQHPKCRSELERSLPENVSDNLICVVKHISKFMWQKECESMLHCVTHKWLGVVTSFNSSTAVWRHREVATQRADVTLFLAYFKKKLSAASSRSFFPVRLCPGSPRVSSLLALRRVWKLPVRKLLS